MKNVTVNDENFSYTELEDGRCEFMDSDGCQTVQYFNDFVSSENVANDFEWDY